MTPSETRMDRARYTDFMTLPATTAFPFSVVQSITCQATDQTTILNFRHLLERYGLTDAIFAKVNTHLADNGIALRSGTLPGSG